MLDDSGDDSADDPVPASSPPRDVKTLRLGIFRLRQRITDNLSIGSESGASVSSRRDWVSAIWVVRGVDYATRPGRSDDKVG